PEAVVAQLARLAPGGRGFDLTGKPVGGAALSASLLLQEAAAHVECGFGIQVAVTLPQLAEGDPAGMPEEPGGLMVQRSRSLRQGPDAQGDLEAGALTAQAETGRCS